MPQISGSLRIFSCGARLCKFDNQTNICDLGYKLNRIGWCQSQSIGKWNSTGFEPSYPVCLIDYKSDLDAACPVIKNIQQLVAAAGNLNISREILGDSFPIVFPPQTLEGYTKEVQFEDGTDASTVVSCTDIIISSTTTSISHEPGADGTFNVHQAGKNVIHHDSNVMSEYWIVDTYNEDFIGKRDNQIVSSVSVFGTTKPVFSSYIIGNDTSISGVGRPYKAITGTMMLPQGYVLVSGELADNPVDICVDDLTSPVVSRCVPDKWSHLNQHTTPVELRVSDSVGGVDIGVLKVTVSGNITIQPHGVLIVSSGSDTTGGHVSITGDINEYIIRYTPPLDWSLGEKITVTTSGQDNIPVAVSGPWSCYSPDFRNVFGDTYSFYVADIGNLGTTIVAIPDSSPPYLSNVSPGMYTRENDAYATVSFDVIDDITGVDITELSISVDGRSLVEDGVSQTSEVSVLALYNGYRISYSPTTRFDYGKSVGVVVYATDKYNLAPNSTVLDYFFTVIDESSLIISDFEPAADTSSLAETKYISANVVDGSYGLKDTYFIVNGITYSGSRTPLYGTSNISTTVSGMTIISGSDISDGSIDSCVVSGTTLSGSSIVGGQLVVGALVGGRISALPGVLVNLNDFTIISGSVLGSSLISGTVVSTLVSGINWDGKYTDATLSGVTVSWTYLSNVVSYGTTVSGIFGYSIKYHPDNDYKYDDVINIYVHAENGNSFAPIIRNELYRLYYGYRVMEPRYEMRHGQQVCVFARATNIESLVNRLSDIYTFTIYPQPSSDISAVIEPKVPWRDMGADITIHSPTHSYGETITVEFYIEDREGNSLGPYIFEYTIENS